MSISMLRRLVAGASVCALLLAFPSMAAGTIRGGCTGEGHSTSGGVDLTTATEWHLKSDDIAGGSGTSPVKMKSASVAAYGLGIPLPIASGTSQDGETAGKVDGVQVAFYAVLGQRFTVAGSATGDGDCSGEIEIILDDVNPLLTVFGGGGILLGIIGLIAVLLFMRGDGGCLNRILSGAFGGLGGVGTGLALEQFDIFDPTEPFGIFVVIGAVIVGFLSAGLFGRHPAAPITESAGAPGGPDKPF